MGFALIHFNVTDAVPTPLMSEKARLVHPQVHKVINMVHYCFETSRVLYVLYVTWPRVVGGCVSLAISPEMDFSPV